MLLSGRIAIVYGAAGAVGSAVAGAYAREGAVVHLAGRTREPLERLASTIREAGGTAHVATVDVLDDEAVKAQADDAATNGGIDVAFNATSNDDVQGIDLTDLPYEQFIRPITKSVTAHHHIATAVAPHMKSGRGGTILVMAGGREAIPALGGAHVAWSALTGLCRQLAAELGPDHIRVAWLLSPGSPTPSDTQPRNRGQGRSGTSSRPDPGAAATLLGRRPSYHDIGNAAAFLSSDWARTMTATELNLTAGAVVD